jgi:2-oxoglutarate ferredoxin oxidoreductase subunit beta
VFNEVPKSHDVTDEVGAYKLASADFPGYFGVLYNVNRPSKNANEAAINRNAQSKFVGQKDWQILQKTFDRMK